MKKAQWLKKPESITQLSLHSASFLVAGKASLYFTIGEEGTLSLSAKVEEGERLSFVFLHTPHDKIVFSSKEIKSSFFGLDSIHNVLNPITELKIEKEKDEITFSSSNSVLLSIKNSAFFSSASFGIEIEGEGEAEISVW